MISAVIFDLDNTLINFWEFKQKAVLAAAKVIYETKLLDKNLEEIYDGIFNIYYSKGADYQYAIRDYLQIFQLSKKEHDDLLQRAVFAYKNTKENILKPYEGIIEMLDELKKSNLKLAILTDATYSQAINRIEKCNLSKYFDVICTFEHSKTYKPSKASFVKVLEELREEPKNVAMVGDNPSRDIKGAKEIGLTTFLAKWGFCYGDDGTKADFILERPADLIKILREINFPASIYSRLY
ncbi:MAG: HAD family hydrolase [Candidatus Anstonellaceae archaeon]